MISDNFDEAFRCLVLEGGTVGALRRKMELKGFDLRVYTDLALLQMIIPIVTEARAQGANNGG